MHTVFLASGDSEALESTTVRSEGLDCFLHLSTLGVSAPGGMLQPDADSSSWGARDSAAAPDTAVSAADEMIT